MFVETTLLNAHKALNSANYSCFTVLVQHSGAQSNNLQDSQSCKLGVLVSPKLILQSLGKALWSYLPHNLYCNINFKVIKLKNYSLCTQMTNISGLPPDIRIVYCLAFYPSPCMLKYQ